MVVVVLLAVVQFNFLLFHSLVELFAINVGVACFFVAWRMKQFQPHDFLLVLGCGYLGVSGLDLIHTLSYYGMGVFPEDDANRPTQFWLAARYLQAGLMLVAPVFLTRKVVPEIALGVVIIVCSGLSYAIFSGLFPDTFIAGQGLTEFKINSEYVIIAILALAGFHLYARRNLLSRTSIRLLGISIFLTICAEYAFTLYIDVYGLSNIVGHFFKLIAFWLILEVIFSKSIHQPLQALDEILWGTNVGTWEWNVQTGETRFNERWAEIVGYTLDEIQPVSIQTWVDFCHPNDLQRSNELLQKHFAGELDYYHCEARMRHKDGHWVWVLDRGKVAEWSDDGKPIRISGTHADISEEKRLQGQMALNLAKFESLLNTAPVGFIAVDTNFKIILSNINAAQMFGYSVEEMIGVKINEFVPKEVHAKHEQLMRTFLDGPDQSITMGDWRLVNGVTRKGEHFPILAHLRKLTIQDTTLTTFICQDMSDTAEKERRLRNMLQQTIEERSRAEAANRSKSTFLSNMSHELRSPLNAIIGFAEMIETLGLAKIRTAKAEEYIRDIRNSGIHLLSLINDILDISKVEADAFSITLKDLNLSQLIFEATRSFLAQKQQEAVEFEISIPPDLQIVGDQRSAYQCVLNLLSNAMKFAPQGTKINLVATVEGNTVRLSVQDEGPGFDEDIIKRIGEPFVHADNAMVAKGGGVGLGLAITKRLMARMGGELHVRNLETGGAQVELTFSMHK